MAETSGHDPSAPETEEAAAARHLAKMRSRRALRAAIERLVEKIHPKQVACLGAGLLHDIPYRALVRGGASVHLVDQVLGNVERGIAQSIIATGEDGRPECVYCTLNESESRINCRRFRVTERHASAICDRFEQSAGEPLRCESFERGGWPFLHRGDATAGYATAFADRFPGALAGASSWRAAFRRARAAARQARRHDEKIDLPDGGMDLVVTTAVMDGFADEPFDSFRRHAATRLAAPTEKEVRTLRRTRAALREELLVEQLTRHRDEIARIMAPGGCCFAAFELFRFDGDERGWFLVRETHQALGLLAERFTFDHDILPPEESIFRIEADDAPAVVQSFVLRHK